MWRRQSKASLPENAGNHLAGTLMDFDPFNEQFRSWLEDAKDRARKLQILERALQALSKITASGDGVSLEEILREQLEIALELCDVLGDGKGLIQLIENQKGGKRELVVHSHYGEKITPSSLQRLPLDVDTNPDKLRGITAVVATRGEPILIRDVRTDVRRKQFVRIFKNTRSALTVPLKVGRACIGVLDLEHSKADAFSVEHQRWVSLLAQLISVTIHTMFQYEQLRGFRELLTLTSQKRDLESILPDLIEAIATITGAETIIIFTLDPKDPQGLVLEKEHQILVHGTPAHANLSVKFGEGVTGRAAALRRYVYMKDIQQLDRVRNGKIIDKQGVTLYREYLRDTRSNWGEPLFADDDVIGVLDLESPRPNAFDALSPDVMSIIASGVSMAIRQDSYLRSLDDSADLLLEAERIIRQHYVLERLNKLHELGGRQIIGQLARLPEVCPAILENEDAMEIIDNLTVALHELSRDTKNLAQLTRAEAGLETTLRQSLNYVRREVKLSKIKIQTQFDEAVASTPVSGRLDLILKNILENAERHVGQGTVWIKAEKDAEQVHFWIRDNGPGIPEEKQQAVLQFGITGGTDKAGSGMGLSIANWCVRSATGQKGQIHIQSAPGKGTTFHFSLPRLHPGPRRGKTPSMLEKNYVKRNDPNRR